MLFKLALLFRYDDAGCKCVKSHLIEPIWEDVERAVRQLNKFQFPFVWFFRSADAAGDQIPDFEIMGGDGDYALAATDEYGVHRRAKFPTHSHRQIGIWISDQGCEMEEKFVCHDINFVLQVLRRYAESGQIEANIIWE
jgi:hypothetical protein